MLVVLSGFLIVLLGLGYILKEHKEVTTALVDSIEQQKLEAIINEIKTARMRASTGTFRRGSEPNIQKNTQKISQPKKTSNKLRQQIIINNLICQSDQQCVLVDIQPEGKSCLVAVNKIGASMLAKINGDAYSPNFSCTFHLDSSQAVCLNNHCSIK